MLNLKTGKHFTDAPTMTRGGFLKGILASGIAPSITLATIANAGSANASVGHGMMRNVGARNAAMFGGGGWKNPYVTDGLIAMWDGEWNVGGNVHDDSSTTWVDLSGNGYDLTMGYASFGENYFIANIEAKCPVNLPQNDNNFYIEAIVENPSEYSHSSNVSSDIISWGEYGKSQFGGLGIAYRKGFNLFKVSFEGAPWRRFDEPDVLTKEKHKYEVSFNTCTIDGVSYLPTGTGASYRVSTGTQTLISDSTWRIYSLRVYLSELSNSQKSINRNVDQDRLGTA